MTTESVAKPAFLGLLNAISLGESRAGVYLRAWAAVSPDPELARALAFVASRESSHGEVFRQRIERLGFTLREKDDPKAAEQLALVSDPTISDADKIRRNRGDTDNNSEGEPEVLKRLDESITDDMDPLTRATMQWYVAEERDSTGILREAYRAVLARAGATG